MSTKTVKKIAVQDVVTTTCEYLPSFDEKRFMRAYRFAKKAHGEQKRKSGEPYIQHPLRTAHILSNLHVDENTLIAALLHDVPEDTNFSIDQIEDKFGKEISFLVDGITKLSKVYYRQDMEERQVGYLKKMLLHTTKDLRVVLIKLADRLHNMRTLDAIPEEKKRLRIAKETSEIYVPIANLLGMSIFKEELQDLCFKYLFPFEYRCVVKRLEEKKDEYNRISKLTEETITDVMKKYKINAQILNKVHSIKSIYNKSKKDNKDLPDIEDIISFDIVVDTVSMCYRTLGLIHKVFKPMVGKVEDRISVPLANGHRRIKTSVFGVEGLPTHFFVKTKKMHLERQYGVLGSTFIGNKELKKTKKTWWAQRILDIEKELKDNKSFLEELKIDIFRDRIFTFTPKGDVIDLPQGATCLDFAYAIHTDVGHRSKKALVNRNSVSLFTSLNNGDTVYIVQDFKQKGPQREWLDFVRTNIAKKKIKDWFIRDTKEHRIQIGKSILQRELDKIGEYLNKILNSKKYKNLCELNNCKSYDDLFGKIADGSLDAKEVLKHIRSIRKDKSFEHSNYKSNKNMYRVEIKITSSDRVGIASEILNNIASLGISVHSIRTNTRLSSGDAIIRLMIFVKNFEELNTIFRKIESVEGVKRVQRVSPSRVKWFYGISVFSFIFWAVHPYMVNKITHFNYTTSILASLLFLFGVLALFESLSILKNITQKTYPEWKDMRVYWLTTFIIINMATLTIFAELVLLDLHINRFIAFASLAACYSFFAVDYIRFKAKRKVKLKELFGNIQTFFKS
jgi:guanosine-3',5'-bis(diphosphate) 3'-pyrophosphohydrolase